MLKPIHKFNNSNSATLCNSCHIIIKEKLTGDLFCNKCKKPIFVISKNFYGINIKKAEKEYKSKYIGDFQTKRKDGSYNQNPVSVFYNPNPDLEKKHNNYFGLFLKDYQIFITDASSCFERYFTGLYIKEKNKVIISCYQHDFVKEGDFFIDGGNNYTRYSLNENKSFLVNVSIKKNKLILINKQL